MSENAHEQGGKRSTKKSRTRLQSAGLCLMAHHFVWSVASAWARAEPDGRIVRIESLWGVPEGLYWYSHDTFEVDIETERIAARPRYKGTFVGSDASGSWVPCRTREPYDWRRSIRREAWITEMAHKTRAIADCEKYPTVVMWLVGTDRRVTPHRVLPWYHGRSELGGAPKAAPRGKLKTARDVRITSSGDWKELRKSVVCGRRVERIVIAPQDAALVRNAQFAEELAELASRHGIVVELAGSILSHAYYVLRRGGVQVECVDLFGADTETIGFNKLVRDEIPKSIERRGENVSVVRLSGEALLSALRQKLVEEAYEVLDAKGGHEVIGELADVLEVVRAMCDALGVSLTEVEEEREAKRAEKGSFRRGLMLTKTSMAGSLSRESTGEAEKLPGWGSGTGGVVVTRADELPARPPYRRPDLRTVIAQPEKVVAFEVDLNRTLPQRQVTRFTMPGLQSPPCDFALEVELGRSREVLRATVRLRLESAEADIESDDQLVLDFEDRGTPGG